MKEKTPKKIDPSDFDEDGIPIKNIMHQGLSFQKVVEKYPSFSQYIIPDSDFHLNKTREALIKYNYYVAKECFGLDIQFEPDKAIIPAIMLRYYFLKYLPLKPGSTVIELGTGATGILALLAVKQFKCSVIATEIDQEYIDLARQNIINNFMEDHIAIINSEGKFLKGVVDDIIKVDYIISNPPYYDEIMEKESVWGGEMYELVGQGKYGEKFIIKMIEEGMSYLKEGGIISFIIPRKRRETMIVVENYLKENHFTYNILGISAGNRIRYIFKIYKVNSENMRESEMDFEWK